MIKHSLVNSTLLLGLALSGTILGWYIVNLFFVTITLWHFILIEVVISVFHGFYNKAKERCKLLK